MARDWKEYLRSQEIKVVPIGDVKPYPNNPRDNEKAVPAVAASIERFGFRNPILVDGDGVIIEGHTRRLAAISLGMEEVPVVYATDLAPDEVDALRVIDNKTAELADWDMDKLAEEMAFPKPAKSELHPTMKPIELIRYQMENSTDYGDVVLDLFGGSGTTMIAAERSGRKCRMMELDPKYATVILDRWEAETGKKAELIEAENGKDGE